MLHTHPVNKNSLFDQPHPLSWQEMYLSPAPEPDTDLHPSDTKDSLYIYYMSMVLGGLKRMGYGNHETYGSSFAWSVF